MKSIEFRISDAYYKTYEIIGKPPTDLFLGKKEMALLMEFIAKYGTVSNQKHQTIGQIKGMTPHETSDETLIAIGWSADDAT